MAYVDMSRPLTTNPSSRSPVQAERRRSNRQPQALAAFLSSPTGGRKIEVTFVDVSRHGIRLRVGSPIASGTYHRLESGTGEQKTAREIRILTCRAEADGVFQIHAEFC